MQKPPCRLRIRDLKARPRPIGGAARSTSDDLAERWQSGRTYRTRNAAYPRGYRGFESHPLRHLLSLSSDVTPVPRAPPHRWRARLYGHARAPDGSTSRLVVRLGAAACTKPGAIENRKQHSPIRHASVAASMVGGIPLLDPDTACPPIGGTLRTRSRFGGPTGNRTRVRGFAVLYVTTPPSGLDALRTAQMRAFVVRVNQRRRFLPKILPRCGLGRAALRSVRACRTRGVPAR